MCNKFANFFLFPKQTFIEEMGGEHREQLTLEEMIDLKELYGVSIAAQVHAAWDIRMISREHYNWWYDERINKNSQEEGWGIYSYPETIGREKRIEARISKSTKSNK
jgi:Zn-dependent peptidase ImmA (M78 family)